jgi:hypothetical protein
MQCGGVAMRMEFRRLIGTIIFETTWPEEEEPIADHNEQAKEALESFYDGNEHCFWPKKEFSPNAPEEVRIINEYGIVVAKYDVHNLAADTKRSLAPKMPKAPKKGHTQIEKHQ